MHDYKVSRFQPVLSADICFFSLKIYLVVKSHIGLLYYDMEK